MTVVDVNFNLILALRELMRYKRGAEKEIWVKGDWATAPLTQNYYHLILGDAVMGNMPFKRWPQFLNHLKNLLRLGGYFVHRVCVIGIGD